MNAVGIDASKGKSMVAAEYSGLCEQPVRRLRATIPATQSQGSVAESH